MPPDKLVESYGGSRRSPQFLLRAIRLNIEGVVELGEALRNFRVARFGAQCAQLIHFKQLDVRAKSIDTSVTSVMMSSMPL